MLAVCGGCFGAPGGYSLGEVLSGVVAAYCRVEGGRAPLDCTPHLLHVSGALALAPALLSVPAHGHA